MKSVTLLILCWFLFVLCFPVILAASFFGYAKFCRECVDGIFGPYFRSLE